MEKSPFSCRKNLQVPSGELGVMGKLVCVRVCVLAHVCWAGNKGRNGKFLLASEDNNVSQAVIKIGRFGKRMRDKMEEMDLKCSFFCFLF